VREDNSQTERYMKYCCNTTVYVKYHSEYTRCTTFRHIVLHGHKIGRKMDYFPGLKPTSHLLNPPVLCTSIEAFQSQLTWKKYIYINSHCGPEFGSHTEHLQEAVLHLHTWGVTKLTLYSETSYPSRGSLCFAPGQRCDSNGTPHRYVAEVPAQVASEKKIKSKTPTKWNMIGRSMTAPRRHSYRPTVLLHHLRLVTLP